MTIKGIETHGNCGTDLTTIDTNVMDIHVDNGLKNV